MAKKAAAVVSKGQKSEQDDAGESQVMLLPSKQKTSRMEKANQERLVTANEYKVEDADGYALAAAFALQLKEAERTVGDLFDEHVKKAHELHKGLTGSRKKLLDPLIEARRIVERKMSNWTLEQQRIEREKAEKERQKEIKQAVKVGDKELVKDLKEQELEIAPVAPKVTGIVTKTVTKFRIVNELKVPRTFLCVDESKIKAHIDKHGSSAQIEGVEIYEDVQTQIR